MSGLLKGCLLYTSMYQTFAGTMATYYCKWIVGDTKIIGNVNTACFGIPIVATLLLGKVMPVSYTHLAVYKRQA